MTRCSQDEGITHVLVRHEQGAAHAAEGYARSTGKPGVVLVTSGPGATNAVTGLTDALMDSIPLVVLTGQVRDPSDRHRRVPGMRHGRHHPALHQAQLAGEGRERSAARAARGLPDRDHGPSRPGGGRHSQGRAVQEGRLCTARKSIHHRTYRPKTDPDLAAIVKAVEMMAAAKRPIFYTGGGIINSGPEASQAAARAGEADRLSHHLDPDGAGRLSGLATRNGWAWSACTAPMKPITPCTIAT